MFYLTTHSTHFIYGYMASDIWKEGRKCFTERRTQHILFTVMWRQTYGKRTLQMAREETRCRHMGYTFRLAAMFLLFASSHRQDSTYHGLCYTSRGALAGTRNHTNFLSAGSDSGENHPFRQRQERRGGGG